MQTLEEITDRWLQAISIPNRLTMLREDKHIAHYIAFENQNHEVMPSLLLIISVSINRIWLQISVKSYFISYVNVLKQLDNVIVLCLLDG